MKGIHIQVLLAVSYSLFLLCVAFILELTARRTHWRAKMYRHRGFRYIRHLDVWECPVGEHLLRRMTDEVRHLVRYRARAEKCNSCGLKVHCTDSNEGREVVHSTEDWMDTEVGRFHRGISLMLLALGVLITIVFWAHYHNALESMIFAFTLASLLVSAVGFARQFWKEAFAKRPTTSDRSALVSASPWSDAADGIGRRKPSV